MNVTICIPTYNQDRYLKQAVESALGQRGCDVEVWVGDDASTDRTPEVMAAFGSDPRVQYQRHARNLGVAANAGWLLGRTTTEFVVRLDSDDILGPDFCAILAAMLLEYPRAGVAHAAVQEIDESGRPRRARRLHRATDRQASETALREGISGYRVAANICMFRRQALPPEPVYRPGTDFVEDWDLYLRIAAAGWDNVYCDRLLSCYRVAGDPGPIRVARKISEWRGMGRLYDDTLQPAYAARRWETAPLRQAREKIAREQARVLRRVARPGEDYCQMQVELFRLGDSPGLRWRLALLVAGLGGALDAWAWIRLKMRDAAKAALSMVRLRRGQNLP